MNVEEIKARIREIEAAKEDNETAHVMESDLRHDVLRAIADGTALDPSRCAEEALKTDDVKFERWFA